MTPQSSKEMDFLYTKKRKKYYAQVIEIYKKTSYGAHKISKSGLVPLDRNTIKAWIINFEQENGIIQAPIR